jgi:hypothetical protein
MVRAMIPHLAPSSSSENIVVWKHTQESNGAAFPCSTSQSDQVPAEFQKADGRERRVADIRNRRTSSINASPAKAGASFSRLQGDRGREDSTDRPFSVAAS